MPSVSNSLPKRKKLRLPDKKLYSTNGLIAHVIIGVYKKNPYFSDAFFAKNLQELLECLKNSESFKIWAYCIMPDHVHLLIETGNKGLVEAVRDIKGKFYGKVKGKGFRWQRSFYDHILRKDETVDVVAQYIWGNPVRTGLVTRVSDYPYIGGLFYEQE